MSDCPENCAVLVPVARDLEPETQEALSILASRGYQVRLLRGASQIDLARSMLATQALRDGFTETLWVDADTTFDPDDVDRLRGHGRPITAGLYVKKGKPEFAGKFRAGTQAVTFGEGGGLLEMEYLGLGFTHVRAEVYAAIAKALPECGGGYDATRTVVPYFLPLLVDDGDRLDYLSEDYSFCWRARAAGFVPLADTTIRLGHVGRKEYTWDDLAPRQTFASLRLEIGGATLEPRGEMSTKLYEQLGRKQERLEELDAAYTALLDVLAGVVGGTIDVSRVLVNRTDRSWQVAETGQRPALPATVNGLPVVVVAPAETEPEANGRRESFPVAG